MGLKNSMILFVSAQFVRTLFDKSSRIKKHLVLIREICITFQDSSIKRLTVRILADESIGWFAGVREASFVLRHDAVFILVAFHQVRVNVLEMRVGALRDALPPGEWMSMRVHNCLQRFMGNKRWARKQSKKVWGTREVRECWLNLSFFLDAPSHLYKRLCPSVGPSVRPSVGPSVRPSRVIFEVEKYVY